MVGNQKHNLLLFCVNFIGKFMDNFQQTSANINMCSYPCVFSGRN